MIFFERWTPVETSNDQHNITNGGEREIEIMKKALLDDFENVTLQTNVPLTEKVLRCNNTFQNFRLETDENMEVASNRNLKTMKYKLTENRDLLDKDSSSMHFCLDDFAVLKTMKYKLTENRDLLDNDSSSMHFCLDDFAVSPLPKTDEEDDNISIQPLEEATLQVGDMRSNNLVIKEDIFQDDLDTVVYNENSECSLYAHQKENVITEMKKMMSMVGIDSLVDKFLTLHSNEISEKNSSLQDITIVQITQPVGSNLKITNNSTNNAYSSDSCSVCHFIPFYIEF
jgi:hypothetical protein